jgi:divalent metal cation (Fe/Co/Zn/Cd) transporter
VVEPKVTSDAERARLVGNALRLEWLTIGWMVIEGAVGLAAAATARSISLSAFAGDSLIELISAGVLIWRLSIELKHGATFPERVERAAARVSSVLLCALAGYVALAAVWALWSRQGQAFSWLGLAVTAPAIPIMYLLARRKLVLAEQLGSAALRADAIEAAACGWLSVTVVAGLLAQLVFRTWWVDPAASLVILGFVLREAREAWTEEEMPGH